MSTAEQAAETVTGTDRESATAPAAAPTGGEPRVWSVDEHLADIVRHVQPLEPLELQLLDAQGCVLVEDVTVPVALPPFDNSSMDGYAVRTADVADAAEDSPVRLTVIGDIAAGSGKLPRVRPGEAARIMTGAPLPPGAEAVVPVEWTDGGTGGGPATGMTAHSSDPRGAGGEVLVHRPAGARAHVRARGSDIAAGSLALAAGTVLGPPQIGLLAAIGRATVKVRPRPRVVVLSTGSELVPPGTELAPGQIHDSNSFALTAAARDAGAIAYRVSAVSDDAETLRATIEDQLIRADLLVTSGGVSVGAYDVVKEALSRPLDAPHDGSGVEEPPGAEEPRAGEPAAGGPESAAGDSGTAAGAAGEESTDGAPAAGDARGAAGGRSAAPSGGVDFRRLAMQPGKPQGFGRIGPDHTPVLTLPGNPVSAYVSFELFVRPAIHALMGVPDTRRETLRAVCPEGVASSPAGKRQFLRGRYADGTVSPVGGAGSHLVKALADADALIVVPEDTTSVAPGAEVDVILLR